MEKRVKELVEGRKREQPKRRFMASVKDDMRGLILRVVVAREWKS